MKTRKGRPAQKATKENPSRKGAGHSTAALSSGEERLVSSESSSDLSESPGRHDASPDILRLVLDKAPDIIAVCRKDGILFANRKFEETTGYSADQYRAASPIQFVHPDDRLMVQEHFQSVITGDQQAAGCSFRVVSRDGSEIWFHMMASSIAWNGEAAMLAILRDMTYQQRIEARLAQAQKLEALGTLSEGIAHEFNNMLMSIQGHASLALMESNLAPTAIDRIKKIQEIVRSGAALTSQLLGFSGTAYYDIMPVDLNDIAAGASLIIEHFNRGISLHRNLHKDLRTIMADRGQIEQVLMNLLVNAGQAMPGGGDLFLETANVDFPEDDEKLRLLGLAPGAYVRLSLTDTGIGMDESIVGRIFDPFFSTKNGSTGTGLGLPSAYGIVRAHGGTIDVKSAPGQGSRFDVYLPSPQLVETGGDSDTAPVEKTGPRATILIVDDEEVVLDVNRELLESLGYQVFEAQSGREALTVFNRSHDIIDLVILDLIMPGMSGAETYRAMREIDPRVKVILLSGYSIEGGAMELLKQGCRAFIQKPFVLENLEQKIQEVLNEP